MEEDRRWPAFARQVFVCHNARPADAPRPERLNFRDDPARLSKTPSLKMPRFYFVPISRMRAVMARPTNSLKLPYWGESTTLLTTRGFWLPVAFSSTPRNP
jgi:hypothetical protein